jgi:hypothetical protein
MSTRKLMGTVAGGALALADIPMMGFQAHGIAKNLGSDNAKYWGYGTGGAVAGGMFATGLTKNAGKLAFSGAKASSRLFATVRGSGVLTAGYAGLEALSGYASSQKEIKEQIDSLVRF